MVSSWRREPGLGETLNVETLKGGQIPRRDEIRFDIELNAYGGAVANVEC